MWIFYKIRIISNFNFFLKFTDLTSFRKIKKKFEIFFILWPPYWKKKIFFYSITTLIFKIRVQKYILKFDFFRKISQNFRPKIPIIISQKQAQNLYPIYPILLSKLVKWPKYSPCKLFWYLNFPTFIKLCQKFIYIVWIFS